MLRPEDTCGRLGGDEFIVLAEQVRGAAEACDVAERIQAALRLPARIGATTVTQTASVGITLLAGRHRAHELLREADTAMYAAKASGPGATRCSRASAPTRTDRAGWSAACGRR